MFLKGENIFLPQAKEKKSPLWGQRDKEYRSKMLALYAVDWFSPINPQINFANLLIFVHL